MIHLLSYQNKKKGLVLEITQDAGDLIFYRIKSETDRVAHIRSMARGLFYKSIHAGKWEIVKN